MNKTLLNYQYKLMASFEARDKEDLALEDDLLADLDQLWLSMTAEEKAQSKRLAREALIKYDAQVNAVALISGARTSKTTFSHVLVVHSRIDDTAQREYSQHSSLYPNAKVGGRDFVHELAFI